MCDHTTETENAQWLSKKRMNRRDVSALGAGALAVSLAGGCVSSAGLQKQKSDDSGDLTAQTVQIKTAAGNADGYFVHPSKGKHPAVIMWPDIAGLRDAYKSMATRLAGEGYAVLVVNQYYRSSPAPILNTMAEWRTEAGQAKLKPMIAQINPDATMADAASFVAWLDMQPSVDKQKKVGSCGYCMGGPFTFRTAAAAPKRVGAICSFHGGGLATDKADSPHLLIATNPAAMLIAIAQNDDGRDPTAKETLRAAATSAGRHAEIEVYPAQHGWCTIDSPVYDQVQAERAWARMINLYQLHL